MYTADNWPIAAKVNFGSFAENGELAIQASPQLWKEQLSEIAELGFSYIDPADEWLPIDKLDEHQIAQLEQVLDEVKLSILTISIGRASIVDAKNGKDNLGRIHKTIDRGHALGAKIVNLGFQQALTPKQEEALWFWHIDGHRDDPKLRDLAIERVRELADHAANLGMQLSLEIYEDTFLGTPEDAVSFYKDVNHLAVGINPDIGNLIRLHRPMRDGLEMYKIVLPYANFWHIKNYLRDEDPATGAYFSAPAPLETGIINYRSAIRFAVLCGFQGPFLVEHYGSDWLGVGARNARYIRSVLKSAIQAKKILL